MVSLRCRSRAHRGVFEPGGADRLDTYVTGGSRVLNAFPAEAVIDRRDHPCGDRHSYKLNVPDNLQVLLLDFWAPINSDNIDRNQCVAHSRHSVSKTVSRVSIRPRNHSSAAIVIKNLANLSWMEVNEIVNFACSLNAGSAPRLSRWKKIFTDGETHAALFLACRRHQRSHSQ